MSKNSERNTVVLFGAGASYGSEPGQSTPPLTNQLIDVLVSTYPNSWGKLSCFRQYRFRRNFEHEMDRLLVHQAKHYNIWGHHLIEMHQELAILLAKFTPSDNSAYRKLVSWMDSNAWRGSIITLNYDQLIRKSLELQSLSYSIPYFPSYENEDRQVELIFPHGNSEMVASGYTKAFGNIIDCDPRRAIGLNNPPEMVNDMKQFIAEYGQVLPAMSYIAKNKQDHSTCRDFLVSHQKLCKRRLIDASAVIVVGVSPNDNDPYIWDAIAQSKCKLYYCDPNPDQLNGWLKRNQRSAEMIPLGFIEATDNIEVILGKENS